MTNGFGSPPHHSKFAPHHATGIPFPDLKGKGREESRIPVGPAAMIDVAAEQQEGVSRLVDMSVVCRYLAAQCLVRQGKWAEATEMLGEANPFRNTGTRARFVVDLMN